MTLTPNIDERGKRLRVRGGIVLFALGVLLLITWAVPKGGVAPWVVGLGTLVGGGFMIFEGRKAWCALRAFGFRTRV